MFDKRNLIIVALGILLLLLVWEWFNRSAQLSNFEDQIANIGLKEQTFKTIIEKNGDKIAQQDQLILTQKQAIKNGLIDIKHWKSVKSQVKVINRTVIDSILVPYTVTDSLIVVDTINGVIDTTKYLKTPSSFDLTNEFYSLKGNVFTNGITLDSFSIVNESKIVIGYKRDKWYKSAKPVVEITNSNPYVVFDEISNVQIQEYKKWYQRKGVMFGIGFISGGIFVVLSRR